MLAYENVIVTDFDGVCAFWLHGFHMWMVQNGYKIKDHKSYDIDLKYGIPENEARLLSKMFNESASVSKLPPYKDAIKYIRKLHEDHGFVFHCISAIPNLPHVHEARWKNIRNLFGETAFERLTLCESSRHKAKYLEEYKDTGCFWIEDLWKNAEAGLQFGMRCILMEHPYNTDYQDKNPDIQIVKNWKEIYQIITGEPT
jgi:FMN phosphatase YigB (HAD superfamily)